jgi:hypothetical protein
MSDATHGVVSWREYNLPTYISFIDYKKAYDNINQAMLWKILTDNGIPTNIIEAIQSLYKNIY